MFCEGCRPAKEEEEEEEGEGEGEEEEEGEMGIFYNLSKIMKLVLFILIIDGTSKEYNMIRRILKHTLRAFY